MSRLPLPRHRRAKCALLNPAHRQQRDAFRATGITEYLRNGGKLEVAEQMANHESARDSTIRRNSQVSLDEVGSHFAVN